MFDYSSDLIFLSDLKSDFIEVNKVACDLLEYNKEELMQMNFRDIKTPKHREFVSKNIKNIIEKRKYTYETEHVTKSGKIVPIEMSSRIVDYEDEQVIISVGRNITDRKTFERKLLSTIIATEEKERKRFSADLHDGLSPILSTIKLYSDLLKKDEFNNTSKEEIIHNIEELTDLAISSAKEIARNITPDILHDFGLAMAVNEFCRYINDTKSISIDVKTNEYKINERSVVETVLYQTIKELINNTLKHSEADNISIELKNTVNQIILYFKDNGIGFNFKEKLENSTGLGLNNIVNKIKTIKGTCDFYSKDKGGMVLLITVRIK
ncbi:MAG: PAS domain S-box protein [Calditrichales bacterium]|nr:PAS domain S-box protein [Calditrichales bacterium]